MRTLILTVVLGACGGGATAPDGASLPAPFTGLPLDVSGATVSTTEDGDLQLKYGDDLDYKGVLGKLTVGMEAGGWSSLSVTPIPGGSAISWQKQGRTVSALAGGKRGKVNVLVELE